MQSIKLLEIVHAQCVRDELGLYSIQNGRIADSTSDITMVHIIPPCSYWGAKYQSLWFSRLFDGFCTCT